jgi:hypothetical protein
MTWHTSTSRITRRPPSPAEERLRLLLLPMAPKRQKTSGAADASQQTLAAAFARPAKREEGEEGGEARHKLSQFMRVLAGVPEFDDYTVNNILNDASGGYHTDTAERAEDGA